MRRSDLLGALLAGLLSGLFGIGPGFAAVLVGLHAAGRLEWMPVLAPHQTTLETCDWISVPSLVAAARSGQPLVIGSSEFGAQDGGQPVDQHILRLWKSRSDITSMPVYPGIRGSGVRKALIVLERLAQYNVTPRRIVVIANHHYMTTANHADPSDLAGIFADPESFYVHFKNPRIPELLPLDRKAITGPVSKTTGLLPRLTMLGRCASGWLAPVDSLLRSTGSAVPPIGPPKHDWDSEWGMDRSFLGKTGGINELRTSKALPRNMAATAFGKDLTALVRATQQRSIPVDLIVLPLNARFYRRIGLDPAQESDAMMRQILAATNGSTVSVTVALDLAGDGLYFDSIHFYDHGRELLARRIVSLLGTDR